MSPEDQGLAIAKNLGQRGDSELDHLSFIEGKRLKLAEDAESKREGKKK